MSGPDLTSPAACADDIAVWLKPVPGHNFWLWITDGVEMAVACRNGQPRIASLADDEFARRPQVQL